MRIRAITEILWIALASFAIGSSPQDCGPKSATFQELNRSLIFQTEADWKRFNKEQYESLTKAAHDFIRKQILAELDSGKTAPGAIEALVRCLQSMPEYQNFRDETNTPAAYRTGSGPSAFVIAYYLYRGGTAIPDTRPYLEAYTKAGSHTWRWTGEVGATFEKSTFFVHQISAGIPEQDWFLLTGFEIGDTGTRLRVEVVSFDGETLKTIWETSGLTHTTLAEVHPNYIILSRYEGYRDGHDVFQLDRYDVVREGLRKRPSK
jgi:hypothetical protein